MTYLNSLKLISNIIRNTVKDLDSFQFRKILYKSLILTLILAISCCYMLYVFLDAYVFMNLEQVQKLTDVWIKKYNYERPHQSLGNLSPIDFANKRMRSIN